MDTNLSRAYLENSHVRHLEFSDLNYRDPIFSSIKAEYNDLDDWHARALLKPELRAGLAIIAKDGSYLAVAVLKFGDGPDGRDSSSLKLSTFKVADQHTKSGLADKLLAAVISKAVEGAFDKVFATVLAGHEDLVRYLELRGFRSIPRLTAKGERQYLLDLDRSSLSYRHINELAYDVMAVEYAGRHECPDAEQESPALLASLLLSGLQVEQKGVIVELGPGSGEVLAEFERAGYRSVGIELSKAMAKIAKQGSPNSTVIIADVLEIDFPPESILGVYAGAFIHLFPESEARSLLARIRSWLRSDGALFINTSVAAAMSSGLELKADYDTKVARYRTRWTEQHLREALQEAGLTIVGRATTDEAARGKYWVAFTCRPDAS